MALFILCDPTFRNSAWCERKILGAKDEAARRRTAVKVFTSIEAFESAAAKLDSSSSVIVLFSKISYIQSISDVLSRLSIHPIITNSVLDIKLPFKFSCTSTDTESDVRNAVEYLYSCGKKRIALLGIDRNSWGDRGMAEIFARYVADGAKSCFYADGDMQSCFDIFLKLREDYDSVILPNDHLAICFIEFLKEKGAYTPDLFVIGRGDSLTARLYGDGLTSITTDFYNCGKAAAEVHFNRLKYGWDYVNIKLKSRLVVRGSTGNVPYRAPDTPLLPCDISPQNAPTLFRIPTNPIGQIDRLLTACDLVDIKLIYCMLCGFSYEHMGDFCFLSIEAVKYRVRKIRKALGGGDKESAARLIRKYIDKSSLLATIEEFEAASDRLVKKELI